MSLENSISAIEKYRPTLGDERVDFFKGLWEVSERVGSEPLASRFDRLIGYLDTFDQGLKAAVEPLDATMLSSLDLNAIKALDVERAAARIIEACGIDPEGTHAPFIELALVSAVQPDAQRVAAASERDDAQRPSGECPVCGAPAALGILRDEGQAHGGSRDLWCSLCETTWRFPRIKCARCGVEHQRELGYRFAEGDPGHRIYTCDVCSGTLKVVNEAELGARIDPRVEEIVLEDLLDAVIGAE